MSYQTRSAAWLLLSLSCGGVFSNPICPLFYLDRCIIYAEHYSYLLLILEIVREPPQLSPRNPYFSIASARAIMTATQRHFIVRSFFLGACRRNSHLGFLAAKSGKQKPMSDLFLSQMVIRSPKCKQKWEDAISKRNSPTGS